MASSRPIYAILDPVRTELDDLNGSRRYPRRRLLPSFPLSEGAYPLMSTLTMQRRGLPTGIFMRRETGASAFSGFVRGMRGGLGDTGIRCDVGLSSKGCLGFRPLFSISSRRCGSGSVPEPPLTTMRLGVMSRPISVFRSFSKGFLMGPPDRSTVRPLQSFPAGIRPQGNSPGPIRPSAV